jgi:hypothetical protein
MTLVLDIEPRTKDVLVSQAAAHGLEVGPYAVSLLEEAARSASANANSSIAKDMVELFAPLRGLNLDFERDRDTGRDLDL